MRCEGTITSVRMSRETIKFPVGVGSHDGLSFRSYVFPLVMDDLTADIKMVFHCVCFL